MKFLGVDLAASYSAYCLLDASGQVCAQGDSFGLSDEEFIFRLKAHGSWPETLTVVEDLPHKIIYRIQVKEVCRLQGRIIDEFERDSSIEGLHFIAPQTWQIAFGVFRKGVKPTMEEAEKHGYVPPDLKEVDPRFKLDGLTGTVRSKLRETAKKLRTDYTDAFLISRWAQLTYAELGTLDVKGIQFPRVGPGR